MMIFLSDLTKKYMLNIRLYMYLSPSLVSLCMTNFLRGLTLYII